jgi:hypothetical protein
MEDTQTEITMKVSFIVDAYGPQLHRYFINGAFQIMKQYLASEPKLGFPMSKLSS